MDKGIEIEPVGVVRKDLDDLCMLEIQPRYAQALEGVREGMRLQVLYWMHELTDEHRRMLKVHPRGDRSRPLRGVFALRSPMRPNPIGVSVVRVQEVQGREVTVSDLDALDGSPLIDIKAAPADGRRPGVSAES